MTVKSSQDNSIEKIETLLTTLAEDMSLALVQARFTQQGKRRILEITVHKPLSRVSLEDCEKLSRALEQHLGELTDSYELQVQSPGIDRKLASERELTVFKGERVEVKSKQPLPGLGTVFTGRLSGYSTSIETETEITVSAPRTMVLPGKKASSKKKKGDASIEEEPPEQITLPMKSLEYVRLDPNTTE